MSRRVALLGLAALVLCVARAVLAVSGSRGPGEVGTPLVVFEEARIRCVELVRGEQRLRLELGPRGWILASEGGLLAQQERVVNLVARLRTWRRERVAGSSADQHAEFGVDASHARRVRLLAEADHTGREPLLAEVWIGKLTGVAADLLREKNDQIDTSKIGFFVRSRPQSSREAEPDEQTWVVNDFLGDLADPSPARWIVRPLVSGRAEEVTQVVVSAGSATHAFRFAPRIGLVGDPNPLDPNQVRGALSALYTLRGLGPAPASAPPHALRLEIRRGSESEALRLWSEGERWFLSRAGLVPALTEGEGQGGVEVSAAEAAIVQRFSDPRGFARTRVFCVSVPRAASLRWRSAGVERSLVRQSGTWAGSSTKSGARQVPSADLQGPLGDLGALKVLEWAPGDLARGDHEWIAEGAWGRVRVVVGAQKGARVPVSTSDVPGYVAWVSASRLAELEARVSRLLGE